jgi:hypothetical protein
MPRSRVIPVAAVLVMLGCRSTDVLRLETALRPETHPDSVRLLAQEPAQPYTVIALVSARSGGWPFPSARTQLLRAAARLGGEAVLLGTESLSRVGTGGEYGGTVVQLTGKVTVFNRQTPRRSNAHRRSGVSGQARLSQSLVPAHR